ncbi:MAG TPA: YicC/YloC family endoribonuclease [Hyphomicrobiales bacterium]|nr:YicC/YloC family endoribonuclease [Hyphomicrobiales bacterium]
MALASMTGFARAEGTAPGLRWTWEIRTVNARGLDVRLRLPPGFDALDGLARRAIAGAIARGTCFANLTVVREGAATALRVNSDALAALAAALQDVRACFPDAAPPTLDGLLALRGVLESSEAEPDEAAREIENAAIAKSLDGVLAALVANRRQEGAALEAVLGERLVTIASLVEAADAHPARRPEAIRARLEEQIRTLLDAQPALDPDRLHQEAVLIATRADVREEIDRLRMHIAASRDLIAAGGAVGRRLDFLAQEFGRESNTLGAKSNDGGLTAIALELKAVVEQFREQVQNVE